MAILRTPPRVLKTAFIDALEHTQANHYTSPAGLETARHAVVGYYDRQHGIPIDPNKVAITSGARPALYFGLRATDRPKQMTGFFVPAYTAFVDQIRNADMKPSSVALPDGVLTREMLVPLLKPISGGAFIFNNPHNPTGRIFSPGEIQIFCDVAQLYDICVVSDFVYADLFDKVPPISMLAINTGFTNVIEVISISKPFRACGWRVGAVVGDPAWVTKLVNRNASLNGVSYANQQVAALAWSAMPEVEEFRQELLRRRHVLVHGLRNIGFTIDTDMQNRSGMFTWAKIPN